MQWTHLFRMAARVKGDVGGSSNEAGVAKPMSARVRGSRRKVPLEAPPPTEEIFFSSSSPPPTSPPTFTPVMVGMEETELAPAKLSPSNSSSGAA